MRYLWYYQLEARDLIISFKNLPSRVLCEFAGKTLADHLELLFLDLDWELIVPVPPAQRAVQKRGFVPTDLLAHAVNKKLKQSGHASRLSFCLKHHGYRLGPQAGLTPERRARNVKDTFSSKKLYSESVLLIDDVLTTGATTLHATLALLEAGASRVDILLLARAPRWHPQSISDILSSP